MLNLTFVLQQLALPIDVERVIKKLLFKNSFLSDNIKVDLNYPFYADDRLSIPKDQSRLYSTKDEFKTYQESIRS